MASLHTVSSAAQGDAYIWPTYSSKLNYSFKDAGITYSQPTKDVNGTCVNAAKSAGGVYHGKYWAFYHGANKNSLVTEAAITPMLEKFDQDFAFITDTLGWPRDSRVQDGYYSSIYLYGSDACTGSNDNTAKGGWQSHIDGYPAVAASYYPVYSFDPASTYNDKVSQQSAMIHEGIHAILTNLGASHVHWFQEGGNTWLQQEMEVRRSQASEYSGMGFLNVGNLMAPFVPIESYSGWLLDGTFGGPGAEGVNAGEGICNWRKTLGGVQYGNLFPTFLGLWVAEGAVPWIWVNIPNWNGEYILESMAQAVGGDQVRSIIMEYRAKLAMLDMKKWSSEMRTLLNSNVGGEIGCEWTPCAVDNVAKWKVTPYAVTTESNGILTPEARTTPGWSGANVIPLTVSAGASEVKLSLQNASSSMGLQIAYRATDGTPVYSAPVLGNNTATLTLTKTPQSHVVFAIVTNTDYDYQGEATRKAHHDYRLKLDAGIASKADPYVKWYDNFQLNYDWDNAKTVTSNTSSSSAPSSSSVSSSSQAVSSSSQKLSSSSQAASSSSQKASSSSQAVSSSSQKASSSSQTASSSSQKASSSSQTASSSSQKASSSSQTASSSSQKASSSSQTASSSSQAVSSSSVNLVQTMVYNVQLPITSDYNGIPVQIELDTLASALGIDTSAISASMIAGVNADGSLYSQSTANGDAGHWFKANGDIVGWSDTSASLFAEWTLATRTVKVGHFPDRVLDGEVYVIRQAITAGSKQVIVEFKVSIGVKATTARLPSIQKSLGISYENGIILASYQVREAGKVKLGIYTGYGALIQNVVNGYQKAGDYTKRIDLKAMGLPRGVYLIKLSYPGHSETQASISSSK